MQPTLIPTQPPTQWVQEVISRGVKRPEREVYHLFPSLRIRGITPPLPHRSLSLLLLVYKLNM